MASMLPVAVYGLKVPAGNVVVPAEVDFPATFRVTMAAIDPSAKSEHTESANGDIPPRATLKMIYDPSGPSDENSEEDSEEEDEYLRAILEGRESDGLSDEDEDESSAEEEKNGGPSDPSKSKKARKDAAAQKLLDSLAEQGGNEDGAEEMERDQKSKVNGIIKPAAAEKGKGKAKVKESDEDNEEIEDITDITDGMREIVICTLDPEKTFQQPIDITIPEGQPTYFKVSGTHTIYLSGNYVIPPDDSHDSSEDDSSEDDYDLTPDEDEIELENIDESDDLDDIEDPRITELDSEAEKDAPQLVKKELKDEQKAEKRGKQPEKGKNKRQAEESDEDTSEGAKLDEIMAKSLKPEEPNGEEKLSKKQLKKLKNNAGKAIEAVVEKSEGNKDEAATKGDKKVQFAKNLEQGPVSSPPTVKGETNSNTKNESKKENDKSKASLGVKVVQGIKIDDRKLGKGPAAKKGDNLGLRYIGKLSDGKVFDANKKGTPFRFRLGANQVVKGWEIGVTGMSVEGERRIIIPAHLGYGSKSPPGIPANSELTFDIKLLEIR